MLNHLLQTTDSWLWTALDVTAKATGLLILATALVLALGPFSAALRHRVWALLFVALLLLPIASTALPGLTWQIIPRNWLVALPTSQNIVADRNTALPAAKAGEAPALATRQSQPRPRVANAPRDDAALERPSIDGTGNPAAEAAQRIETAVVPAPSSAASASHWLGLVWLIGTLLAILPLVCGVLGSVRLKLHCPRVSEPAWLNLLDELREDLGLHRAATLLWAAEGQMPMTFGFLRPCVVLPADALAWSAERQRVVLLHELAHIKRYDVPWQMVARVACAIYWFHPLAWWALRRMRLDREHACDDCVLAAGQKASSYATHLLEIARVHRACSPLASAALSMARRSQLEGRLLAVLDERRARAPIGAARAFALMTLTVVAVLALGVVRPALRIEATALGDAAAAVASADRPVADGDVRIVTGTVLSPQGKPLAGANIEVFALDANTGWPIYRTRKQTIDYRATTSDRGGRFEVRMPRHVLGMYPALWLLASADTLGPRQVWLKPRQRVQDMEVKLTEAKTVRVQLVDTIGNPVSGVKPEMWNASSPNGESNFWLPDPEVRSMAKLWPSWTRSDERGYTSVVLGTEVTNIQMLVEDERFGCQLSGFKLAAEPTALALFPGLQIIGKVVAADTGQPIAGALVTVMERPYHRTRTLADGSFRVASSMRTTGDRGLQDEVDLHVYPPGDSAYLFQIIETKKPDDGGGKLDLSVKLLRGELVEGQVTERGTHKPVAGANVSMMPQEYNNPLFRRDSWPSYGGETQMQYATDAQGHFRMPVWPGPGYLLVKAPTIDYVHVMVSDGDKYYGKPGLQRQYHDGALKINLKPGETPSPLAIELERGVTLKRRVVRPDGQPAGGTLHARSYVVDTTYISGHIPALMIENGRVELPGFEPAHSNPLFLLDLDRHCGATVSPKASEIGLDSPPIQLKPCGAAKFRFLDEEGQPIAGHEPRLHVVVTPGAPATHSIEPDRPLWSDTIIWQNVFWDTVHRNKLPKTDANGYVTVNDLIPGATYNLSFVSKQGVWDEGYEFTVRSGETTEVGDVRLYTQK